MSMSSCIFQLYDTLGNLLCLIIMKQFFLLTGRTLEDCISASHPLPTIGTSLLHSEATVRDAVLHGKLEVS